MSPFSVSFILEVNNFGSKFHRNFKPGSLIVFAIRKIQTSTERYCVKFMINGTNANHITS